MKGLLSVNSAPDAMLIPDSGEDGKRNSQLAP
jgi:hypothetical protein